MSRVVGVKGKSTGAYKKVREDVVNPQNLLHKLRKNSENSTNRGISSCEKNFSVQKRYMNFSRQRKMPLDVLLYEFFYFLLIRTINPHRIKRPPYEYQSQRHKYRTQSE